MPQGYDTPLSEPLGPGRPDGPLLEDLEHRGAGDPGLLGGDGAHIEAPRLPLAERYLRRLEERLRATGIEGALFIMQSNGGVCDVDTGCRYPVRLIESGPAAGVIGAALFALDHEGAGDESA